MKKRVSLGMYGRDAIFVVDVEAEDYYALFQRPSMLGSAAWGPIQWLRVEMDGEEQYVNVRHIVSIKPVKPEIPTGEKRSAPVV